MLSEYLGYIGGALTTFCYVPQIIRIFRVKSANEISFPFTILLLTGVICWMLYGIFSLITPVIIWNAISAVIVSVLIFAKLKYSR